MIVWYSSCTVSERKDLHRVVKVAGRIIGTDLPSLDSVYTSRLKKKASSISRDTTHPGHCLFDLLPSGKRYTAIRTKTNRLRNSFFPRAVVSTTPPQHIRVDLRRLGSALEPGPSRGFFLTQGSFSSPLLPLACSSTMGPHHHLAISFGNSLITPTEDARSLGVILDGQLSFSAHTANLTRSCRFLLYNIRRIPTFLSQEATQLLVQSLVISRLDYCNLLLAGLPLWAIRALQLVQNAAARLIFNLPKFTHVTPLLHSLHWLPVVKRIRFKTLMLAFKAKTGPAPPYLMAMVKSRSVPRAL
ncbi:hypothetical protein NFI96_001943 [Prochilodus magdalenae]|nr:hypothetical protein NFI96_001943 [Prochilodus magdalenae]